jgi:hypothetical protein
VAEGKICVDVDRNTRGQKEIDEFGRGKPILQINLSKGWFYLVVQDNGYSQYRDRVGPFPFPAPLKRNAAANSIASKTSTKPGSCFKAFLTPKSRDRGGDRDGDVVMSDVLGSEEPERALEGIEGDAVLVEESTNDEHICQSSDSTLKRMKNFWFKEKK